MTTSSQGGPIICHRISGIGDLMLQAAHAIFLGESNGVNVYVDWRRSLFVDEHELMFNIFSNQVFHPRALPVEALKRPDAISENSGMWECVANAKYGSTLSEQNFLSFLSTGHTARWAVFEGALNQHELRPMLFPLLAEFQWSAEIMKLADRVWDSIRSDNVVAIHYRHGNGEFSSAKTEAEIAIEMNLMIDAARSLTHSWDDFRVLICTDSISADRYFRQRIGDAVVTQHKLYPRENSGAMHYASIESGNAFNRKNSLVEALVDIELMGRCSAIVKDERSTFPMVSVAKLRHRLGASGVVLEVPTRRLKARFLSSYSVLSDALAARQR